MTIEDADLLNALSECKHAARKGYQLARDNLHETEHAIRHAKKNIQEAIRHIEHKKVHSTDTLRIVQDQLTDLISNLEKLHRDTELDLAARERELEYFNVTLFGRTMAGKSTIMEILTRGDGSSIGKGAQRTTRDVRAYTWKGLRVTDVPGVAAFEGKDDEQLAFQSASKADLVLFLITDDAPQAAEAECLANVRQLGKPILGILNVKATLNNQRNIERFLTKPEKIFDKERLETIKAQLFELTNQYLPGIRIPFIYIHADARYRANQPDMRPWRNELQTASRFFALEKALVQRIKENGSFFRLKTFVDAAVGPILEVSDQLLEFRESNSGTGRVLNDKLDQMRNWRDDFAEDATSQIDHFAKTIRQQLEGEIADFAEDHYQNKSAEKAWTTLVDDYKFGQKSEKLQKRLTKDCQERLTEFLREINAELKIISSIKAGEIHIADINDTKSWGRWLLAGAGGILSLAGLFIGAPWVFVGGIIVGFLSLFWDKFAKSREAKITEARQKLESVLLKHVHKLQKHVRKELHQWFNHDLMEKHIDPILQDVETIISAVFRLADTQRALADMLIQQQQKLNMKLFNDALVFKGYVECLNSIHAVARIPGFAIAILIQPGVRLPDTFRRDLEQLFAEKLIFVIDNKNTRSIFNQILKRKFTDRVSIYLDEKLRFAGMPLGEFDQEALWLARLGQQLTGFHVINYTGQKA